MGNEPIVIIGASAAGISAAREIRNVDSEVPIMVFTEETHLPYYRPFLTECIGDDSVEKRSNFYLNPEKWYGEKNVTLHLGKKFVRIDAASGLVESSSGEKQRYRKLILANGSSPFIPIKDAMSKKHVYSVRTLADARAVNERTKEDGRAIVIGGGLLGLEAAYSLSKKGMSVTVVEVGDRILPRQLDTECSAILQNIITRTSVKLLTGKSVESITGGDAATGVKLASGENLPAGLVIFSIGVRPNVDLAKSCGAEVNRAVVVNGRMETSVPGVYACGDVAEFNGKNIALWMPAMKQGKVAGSNAAGREALFADDLYPALLNSFGTKIFSLGDFCNERREGEYRVHVTRDADRERYRKLYFVNDRMVGVILIGDISESGKLTAAIKNGATYNDMVN